MKKTLVAFYLLTVVGVVANASTLICETGEEETYRQITISNKGAAVQFYENNVSVPAKDLKIAKSGPDDQDPTTIYSAVNVQVKQVGEGMESLNNGSITFIYNQKLKAGRLTVMAEGFTYVRNQLIDKCMITE